MSDIRLWLEELGLGQYADAFDENDIRLGILSDLTPDDLKDIGVQSVGHRRALLSAIATLREGAAGEPGPADPPPPDRDIRPPEAERRQITVLFCDLVGSTALSAKLDPEELRDVMAVYQNAAGAVIERYDGHVAQYLGDGLMTYFGWPQAHEDDAQRAIRAGLDIIGAVKQIAAPRELLVRVGIATGPVVVGETGSGDASVPKTAVGKTPNLAARVQGLAAPDTVLIAHSTRQLIGGTFALDDLGRHRLKGIGGETGVFRVTGESAALSRFDAAHGAGLTAFVGRESETALLAERWSQAAEGEGHVVLLGGEAGIGKSRILKELRDGVADEPHIRIRYQCSPYHANSAYYPLIEQLERAAGIARDDDTDAKLDKLEAILTQSTDDVAAVVPLIAAMMSLPTARYPPLDLSPQMQKDSLIATLADQVAGLARDQPVLMIFEDAHWSDPTTLEAFGAIINRVQDAAVLLVITYRPEFTPPWASHGHVTVHALNRLGRRQGAAMVAKVTGGKPLPDAVLDQIVAKTDGVPLFVEELTKTVLEAGFLKDCGDRYELDGPLPDLAIPATLQDSLMARLDRLSSVKEVAQIGACIGREFSHELLAAVSPLGDNELRDALQQLVGGGLIFVRGIPPRASYSFKHALVQDAAYQSLLKSRCQQFHKSIAQTLENRFPDLKDTAPELIAHHYTEGGLAAPAVGYWRAAGERATDHFAHIEAIDHLRKALTALNTLEASGDYVEQELDLRLGLVASMRLLDRYEDALEELDHAEALATAQNRSAALTRIHYSRGNIYFPMGNVEGCLTEHEAARKFAIEAGSPEDEARALGGLGDAYYMRGRMLTAHDHFDRCIKLCQTHGFVGIEVAYLYMRATSHVYQIQFAEALDDCQAAIESAAAAGEARAEIVAHLVAGEILYEQRAFDRAEEHARKSLDVARRLGARRFEPFLSEIIARIRIIGGDRAQAREILEECLAISRDTGLSFIGPWILGAIAWASDDPERRRQALAEGQTILDQGCVGHNYYWFYRDAMEAMLGVGQWDEVETYAAALEAYTSAEKAPWAELFIARGRALARFHQHGPEQQTVAEITRVRDWAAKVGVETALPLLDAALASVNTG